MGKRKSLKEDASVKNGNTPPFSLNSDEILVAVPVIQSQVLSSRVSTLVVLENFAVGDVLHHGMSDGCPSSISTSLQSWGLLLSVVGRGGQVCAWLGVGAASCPKLCLQLVCSHKTDV